VDSGVPSRRSCVPRAVRAYRALNTCVDINIYVPVRTVTLTTDAYDALAALKKEGESFSQVVRRLTGSQILLSSFAGAWAGAGKARVDEIRATLRRSDQLSRAKLRRLSREDGAHGQPR
jgi:predicted CopG family antitoxin